MSSEFSSAGFSNDLELQREMAAMSEPGSGQPSSVVANTGGGRELPIISFYKQQYFGVSLFGNGELMATKILLICSIIGFILSASLSDQMHGKLSGNVESILIEAKILKLASSVFIYGRPIETIINSPEIKMGNDILKKLDKIKSDVPVNKLNSPKPENNSPRLMLLSDNSNSNNNGNNDGSSGSTEYSDIPIAILSIGFISLLAPLIERRSPHGEFIGSNHPTNTNNSLLRRDGSKHLLFLTITVCIISEIIVLCVFLSQYYFAFDTYYLEKSVYGLPAMIGALTISCVEIMPDSRMKLVNSDNMGTGSNTSNSVRVKYAPLIVALICVFCILFNIYYSHALCILVSLYVSWIYLRFFSSLPLSGRKGNSDESFAFAQLFPKMPIIQAPVKLISEYCYKLCTFVGCCEIGGRSNTNNNNSSSMSTGSNIMSGVSLISHRGLSSSASTGAISSLSGGGTAGFLLSGSSAASSKSATDRNLNPEQAQQRIEAKKLIETRLATLQREMHDRAMVQSHSNS